MSTADGYVLPKPGVPKTLGILNIIFAVLLVFMGLCTVASLAAAPAMFSGIEKIAKDAQAKQEAQGKAELKAYDDRIAAAKTDEEKKAIEQEKANAAAAQPRMNPVDLSAATGAFKDPKIMAVNYASSLSGLVLHIMLLISGIGLIRLTSWGRSLAVWWGGLQILQVLAVAYGTIVYALPANQAIVEKQVNAIQKAAPADPGTAQVMKVSAAMAMPIAVGTAIAGMIYPIVVLILLNGQGARAACLAKKKLSVDDL